jgi:hypothetical protein
VEAAVAAVAAVSAAVAVGEGSRPTQIYLYTIRHENTYSQFVFM